MIERYCRECSLFCVAWDIGVEPAPRSLFYNNASLSATQALITDHVVVRGRYTNVTVSLLGHRACPLADAGVLAQAAAAAALPDPFALLPAAEDAPMASSASTLPLALPQTGPLPLVAVPQSFAAALDEALSYFRTVGASPARISDGQPPAWCRELRTAADAISAALAGAFSASDPSDHGVPCASLCRYLHLPQRRPFCGIASAVRRVQPPCMIVAPIFAAPQAMRRACTARCASSGSRWTSRGSPPT